MSHVNIIKALNTRSYPLKQKRTETESSMGSDYKIHSDVVLQQWQMLNHLLSDTTRQVNIDGLHLDISQVICVSRFVNTGFGQKPTLILVTDTAFDYMSVHPHPSLWKPAEMRLSEVLAKEILSTVNIIPCMSLHVPPSRIDR